MVVVVGHLQGEECQEGRKLLSPSRSSDAVVFLSCPGGEVALIQREGSVILSAGLGGGETELPEEAFAGAVPARPELTPAPQSASLTHPSAPLAPPSGQAPTSLSWGRAWPIANSCLAREQDLQTLGKALAKGWRTHGGVLLQPGELKKWEQAVISTVLQALGPTHHCAIRWSSAGRKSGSGPGDKGQLGSGLALGSWHSPRPLLSVIPEM